MQFYFVGNKYEFAQIFTHKKLLSHENAIFYTPTIEEIRLAELFAKLNGDSFNGVQRIDFLKLNNRLLLSELEDDSPYMAIEALSDNKKQEFIDDFKQMVYAYYNNFKNEKKHISHDYIIINFSFAYIIDFRNQRKNSHNKL